MIYNIGWMMAEMSQDNIYHCQNGKNKHRFSVFDIKRFRIPCFATVCPLKDPGQNDKQDPWIEGKNKKIELIFIPSIPKSPYVMQL